ncbi:MAG TPA: hypothetical protein VNO33_11240 [Kofleriaceae bacterium]|nr:hypothetical protein [Kofleriaceae bacterium]
MSAAAPVGPAFAAVLRAEREVFNEKFAEARRRRPDLDERAFLEFLRGAAAGVVEHAAAADGDRCREVAHAAYDAALTLVSEKLAGPGGRHAEIDETWQRLLPAVAALVVDQPARVIGSLTNAVFQLAQAPGARPREWIDLLVQVAPGLASVADLLKAGQLAAWRAGLAHLRGGALEAGDALAPELGAALVGAPRGEWSELRARLARDAWWAPPAGEGERPSIARMVGGFRGFGGLFAAPPVVAAVEGHILVSAGGECWVLAADVFGATLHRIDPQAMKRAARDRELQVERAGVAFRGAPLPLPAIGEVTSAAAVPGTVAVTGALTHAVTLIAMPVAGGGA